NKLTLGVGHLNSAGSNGGPDLAVGKIQATGGGVITIADSNLESGTISASIAGTAGVNKNTSGNVTFSGANTYTGNTTVNMGTLNLTASSNTNPVKLVLNGVASTASVAPVVTIL